jgi:hypothetical protein
MQDLMISCNPSIKFIMKKIWILFILLASISIGLSSKSGKQFIKGKELPVKIKARLKSKAFDDANCFNWPSFIL